MKLRPGGYNERGEYETPSKKDLLRMGRLRVRDQLESRKRPISPVYRRKLTSDLFDRIRYFDRRAGTAEHPYAAYSHGVWSLADAAVSAEIRRKRLLEARKRLTKSRRSR